MGRVGVLLLNLGGPDKLEDVGPFLYNLFSDPEIIRLPFRWLQKPLAWFIASRRTEHLKRIISKSVAVPHCGGSQKPKGKL